MTYWYTAYWTSSLTFIKYVSAEVLIDNSFWLCRHNDINNQVDMVEAAAGLVLLHLRCQSEAAACHLNNNRVVCSQLIKAKEKGREYLSNCHDLPAEVTTCLGKDTWGGYELKAITTVAAGRMTVTRQCNMSNAHIQTAVEYQLLILQYLLLINLSKKKCLTFDKKSDMVRNAHFARVMSN